jgi:hypothetical protein
MEAVDCMFRDILNNSEKPFDGLIVIFSGDFRQILPVIIQGSRGQTVAASIQRSFLWHSITVLHLHQNMHLSMTLEAEGNISLSCNFRCEENKVDSLIDAIHPSIGTPNLSNLGSTSLSTPFYHALMLKLTK